MERRRPPNRIEMPRSSENQKRHLSATPPTTAERTQLSSRATYGGYGKHKRNPDAWKLPAYHGGSTDRTFCEDAGFTLKDRKRAPSLLRRGITAGLFGDLSKQGDPTMLWTIDDNGWVYEFRLTVPSQARYHGYPVRPANAFARKVIDRYGEWLDTLTPPQRRRALKQSRALLAAQKRYN